MVFFGLSRPVRHNLGASSSSSFISLEKGAHSRQTAVPLSAVLPVGNQHDKDIANRVTEASLGVRIARKKPVISVAATYVPPMSTRRQREML